MVYVIFIFCVRFNMGKVEIHNLINGFSNLKVQNQIQHSNNGGIYSDHENKTRLCTFPDITYNFPLRSVV